MGSSSADRPGGSAPWRRVERDGSIVLEIHAQPGAKRTEVVGVHGGCLKIRLAAPPVEGRANAALVAFLAEQFGVPRSDVTILRGHTARRKTVCVASPPTRPDEEWAGL